MSLMRTSRDDTALKELEKNRTEGCWSNLYASTLPVVEAVRSRGAKKARQNNVLPSSEAFSPMPLSDRRSQSRHDQAD
jgi:hypothetical protein